MLEAAIAAPSGENSQPWHFTVRQSAESTVIDVGVSEVRDQSLYGWGNRASYVAIGAALENIRIAASAQGSSALIELLPQAGNPLLAARVTITKRTVVPDVLAPYIHERATNRKPYDAVPLTHQEQQTLMQEAAWSDGPSLTLVTERDQIQSLAQVGSVNELVMLNNPTLHQFFFSHVNWTREEDVERKVGFFIDTLELPTPARIGFRVMSNWKRARLLNRLFGFNTLVAKQNAALYATASAIGIVVSPKESPLEALRAGMYVERLWLTTTRLGLSIQPLTGVLYWAMRERAGVRDGFSKHEHADIMRAYTEVDRLGKIGNGASYFMFRIGHADSPTARAIRFPVDDVVTVL